MHMYYNRCKKLLIAVFVFVCNHRSIMFLCPNVICLLNCLLSCSLPKLYQSLKSYSFGVSPPDLPEIDPEYVMLQSLNEIVNS